MTTIEQMEELTRMGHSIIWMPDQKMFWAIKFDDQDDRRFGWLDASEWGKPSDCCGGEDFAKVVARTHAKVCGS